MFRTKTQNNVSLKPPPVICVSGLQSYYESACKFALCFRYFETQNLIKSMHTEQIGNWWQPLTWQPCNHPGKEHSRMNGSSPYRGPVRDEKMLSITNHQEDTNQSHGEMPPHSHQDGLLLLLSCFSRFWLFATLWTVAHHSSVHGVLQARMLVWVAMPSSRGSSWPRDRTRVSYVSCIGWQVLYHKHHLGSPLRMAYCPKTENYKHWQGCGEMEPLCPISGNVK